MSPHVFWNVALGSLLVVLGCSSKGDDENADGSGGMPAAGAGGAAGGGAGGAPNLCPADPGVMTCGSETCSEVEPSLASICVQNCCTSDMKCGTHNALRSMGCVPELVDESMCPTATVFGMEVPGCCVPNDTLCGVQDVSGLFGGGCVPRCSVAALSPGVTNVNCDGTPAGECAAAGSGGMSAGGSAGSGGMGAGGSAGD
jgi:hypothetical protein